VAGAPTYVSAGAYLDGSAANAPVPVPGSTAAGRVAIVGIYMDGAQLGVNPTPPTGFTLVEGAPCVVTGNHTVYAYWKRLTGADAGTWTWTWIGSRYREACAVLYDNVIATGTPFDSPTSKAIDAVGAGTVTPAVNVTSLGPDRRLIWLSSCWSGGTWTEPTGHTKRVQAGAGLFTLTDRSWPTASATGSVTGSVTNADKMTAWLGALIGTTSASTPSDVPQRATRRRQHLLVR